MKKLILIICSFTLTANIFAQLPSYQWANGIGSTMADEGRSIVVDASGNIYITGNFQDTVDFDPSPTTANLIGMGERDIFVAKYNSRGVYQWAKSIGGINFDAGRGIAIDASGNIYITGIFGKTADFDPSASTANLTAAGTMDIFVAKYDSNGNYKWAFNMGDSAACSGYTIITDASNNVYVTGYFSGTSDFNPSPLIANLTSAGKRDIFVAKYNSSGNYQWAFNVGGANDDHGYSIGTDASGNVYVTGSFRNTADFDPSTTTANLTAPGIKYDMFVAKYNRSGAYQWAFKIGDVDFESGNDLDMDAAGNVYLTGGFEGTVDFDPSPTSANLTSVGKWDIFVAKYNSSGAYQWAFNTGGTNIDQSLSMDTDASGNIYLTGSFEETVDFDHSVANAYLTSGGLSDIFVAKYNSRGAYQWAFNPEGAGDDYGLGITTDASGNVYVTGYFGDTCDFDPTTSIANLTATGSRDMFLVKYKDIIVGLQELEHKNNLILYPNPASSNLLIQLEDLPPEESTLKIIDYQGRTLKTIDIKKIITEVDMEALPKGIYLICLVSNGQKIATKKCIKIE